VRPVAAEPLCQVRLIPLQPLEERSVEVGEPLVPVEILVREPGLAEREVPPGEDWRRDFGGQANGS